MYSSSATTRSLQSTESAHKHTTAELQRTRTLLQAIRATHQSELKKKEKEVERMVEKWSKIADVQAKLSATASGMRCANLAVVEGSEMLGKGQGFLELALDEAENARGHLLEENVRLKTLLLDAVNGVQAVIHESLNSDTDEAVSRLCVLNVLVVNYSDPAFAFYACHAIPNESTKHSR